MEKRNAARAEHIEVGRDTSSLCSLCSLVGGGQSGELSFELSELSNSTHTDRHVDRKGATLHPRIAVLSALPLLPLLSVLLSAPNSADSDRENEGAYTATTPVAHCVCAAAMISSKQLLSLSTGEQLAALMKWAQSRANSLNFRVGDNRGERKGMLFPGACPEFDMSFELLERGEGAEKLSVSLTARACTA